LEAKSVTRPKLPERKAQPWTLDEVEAIATALPRRFAVLPYLGAGTGMRQGEAFGLAVDDIDFLHKVIHVRRQVRLVGNTRCFAPVKNGKSHDVPLSESLAPYLAEHIRLFPPVEITLPWLVPDGELVTLSLLVTGAGGALHRTGFNKAHWRPARRRAGITPPRWAGMHVLRHTAASAWLSAGVDVTAVAEWLGDTVQTVYATYAHMVPGANDRGRKAMDLFFTRSALHVPSEEAL
jgi:integrase